MKQGQHQNEKIRLLKFRGLIGHAHSIEPRCIVYHHEEVLEVVTEDSVANTFEPAFPLSYISRVATPDVDLDKYASTLLMYSHEMYRRAMRKREKPSVN